jgi:DegV family protein with EDD domain
MSKVAIVTDSTATVPESLVNELDIHIVPVLLLYGSQTYRDGIDITPGQVYGRLRAGGRTPTSAAPSVGDFLRVYARAGHETAGILSIHMSPDLSTTYNVAAMAGQLVDGTPVRVFHCQTAAIGQGFVVIEAARAAASGASLDQVVDRAQEVDSKVQLLFTLDTLEYLHRSGRIGRAVTLVGSVLQIRPILFLEGGHVDVLCKPRTKAKAIRLILDRIEEEVGKDPVHMAVFHADAPQEAEDLRRRVVERFRCVELYTTEFTPVMGAHTGPGLVGISFYRD